MAVQEVWCWQGWAYDPEGDGASLSGTVSLPHRMPFAFAQVALTRSAYFDTPGWNQVYLTGYSANGNPVTLDNAPVVLGIYDADSFTVEGDAFNGAMTASLTVYCFE
jgi:hypothetical protein